jgi:hypothetical protein
VTWEEGTWAAWLYDLLQPQVQQVLVCNPRRNALLRAIVKVNAKSCGLPTVAPHDLRRYAESRIMPSFTAVRAWVKEEPVNGSA